jgi:hypothetical protein
MTNVTVAINDLNRILALGRPNSAIQCLCAARPDERASRPPGGVRALTVVHGYALFGRYPPVWEAIETASAHTTRKFRNCHGSDVSTSSGNNRPRSSSGVQSL